MVYLSKIKLYSIQIPREIGFAHKVPSTSNIRRSLVGNKIIITRKLHFYNKITQVSFTESYKQWTSTGSVGGLVLKGRKSVLKNDDVLDYWRINASLGSNVLNENFKTLWLFPSGTAKVNTPHFIHPHEMHLILPSVSA